MNKQTVYKRTEILNDYFLDKYDTIEWVPQGYLKKLESVYVFTEEEFTRLKSATEALAEILEIPQIAELARHFKSAEPYGTIVETVKKIAGKR